MRILLLVSLAATAATAETAHRPGHPFRDVPIAPEMVAIPAGAGVMGSTEAETTREGRTPAFAVFEHPQRNVTFEKPFAIATHHVTRREFAAFVAATGRPMAGCVVAIEGKWTEGPDPAYSWTRPGWAQRDDEPAICVSWEDAAAYAAWLARTTGKSYRLPSEDEWEYAARAGTRTARWWGDAATGMCARANGGDRSYAAVLPSDKSANPSCDDHHPYTSPVGRYPASPWRLHDMYGNAWQWIANCFSTVPGGVVATPCAARAIRGGSWHSSVSTLRSATRFSLPSTLRSSSLGFRVARDLP